MPSASCRRHFLPWDRPWLPQAVAWLAGSWRGGTPLDLSEVLAVVPTRQAGRRLREALADYADARGSAVFSPRVLTPDTLTGGGALAGVASRLQALLAWVEVLRSVDLDAFRHVFPVDPPARNFVWALRLAQEFTGLQATLADAGLTLAAVPQKAGPDFVEAARWSEIAELGHRHAAALAQRGLREPQAERIRAATEPAPEAFRRVVVLAVPEFTPLALARLQSLAERRPVDVLVFAPESEAERFDPWGQPRPESWARRNVTLREFETHVHLCADPAAQAAQLAELAGRYESAAGTLALGAADPEVLPLLENELRQLGRAVFNPEGRPLRREALHQLLSALAAVAREPTFAAVAALARCPDLGAYLRRDRNFSVARWLAGLDELHARHLPADLAAAIAFAPRIAGARPDLEAGLAAIAQLRSRLNAGDFAVGVADVLREIFADRQLDSRREEDRRWQETASAWSAVVGECAVAAAQFGPLAPADWWDLALRLFGDQRRTEEKPEHAIELQGWLELLWEDAPHLAIAGLNDGRVPESVIEDAFLPGSLRERLGLPTNAARFARDAYMLQAMAACRAREGQLDVLLGKTSAAGDPLRPSRLLLRCDDAELPDRVAFLFLGLEPVSAQAAWRRAWQLRPRPAAPPARVAVTALRQYLQCPFRFYLRHVLKMQAVDPLKSELDAFDFGTLCHAALEQIGLNAELRAERDPAALRAVLVSWLDRVVRDRYGAVLPLPLLVQVESARQRIGRLAELQAEERAAGWETIAVERPFEIDVSGLLVRGKIDRIDRHAGTGEIRVLDYKTSDTAVNPVDAHLRGGRGADTAAPWARLAGPGSPAWIDLQLPLYLRALAPEFPGRLTCGYFNLPKASGETRLALWADYTPEIHASAMHCAEEACAAIRRGEFWPPNETIAADRDDYAALFHHGVVDSIAWPAP